MKRLLKEQAKEHGFVGKYNFGEYITEYRPPFIATTLQRQEGYATADTRVYLITGEYINGDHKLLKHPNIKGSKGYRALGG